METSTGNKTDFSKVTDTSENPDMARITALLHETGLTPYLFVRRGLKYLVNGQDSEARKYLALAMEFRGVFFEAGSPEDIEYAVEMELLNDIFVLLTGKFKRLPVDIDTGI